MHEIGVSAIEAHTDISVDLYATDVQGSITLFPSYDPVFKGFDFSLLQSDLGDIEMSVRHTSQYMKTHPFDEISHAKIA